MPVFLFSCAPLMCVCMQHVCSTNAPFVSCQMCVRCVWSCRACVRVFACMSSLKPASSSTAEALGPAGRVLWKSKGT